MTTLPMTFTGLSLTDAQRRLYAPFTANAHEQHEHFKFWYLKEEAINTRLTEVFGVGGWGKRIDNQEYVPSGHPVVVLPDKSAITIDQYPGVVDAVNGKYFSVTLGQDGKEVRTPLNVTFDIPIVLTVGGLTTRLIVGGQVIESRYDSVGADVLTNLGKERGARLMNTFKASDTDLLKRVARQIGVGLYLTQISVLTKQQKADYKIDTEDGLGAWIRDFYGPTNLGEAKKMLIHILTGKHTPEKIGQIITELQLTDDDLLFSFRDSLNKIRSVA